MNSEGIPWLHWFWNVSRPTVRIRKQPEGSRLERNMGWKGEIDMNREKKNCCFTSLSSSQSVQSQLYPTFCDPVNCSKSAFPVHHQLPELAQTHVHWVGDAMQPSHRLWYPFPPAFNLSQHQGLFQWVGYSHQVAKYWSFSFSISPSSEYSGLISFRIDWFDLLSLSSPTKSKSATAQMIQTIHCSNATAQIFALLIPLNEHRKSYLLLHSPHKTGKVAGLWIIFGKVFSFSMIF